MERYMHPVMRVLKEHFDNSDLTQRQLADKIGTTQSAVSDLFNSGANPKLNTLTRLCEVFDVTLAVIGVNDKPEPEIIEHKTYMVPQDVEIKIAYDDEGARTITVKEL